jgi:hypothetical protein
LFELDKRPLAAIAIVLISPNKKKKWIIVHIWRVGRRAFLWRDIEFLGDR